MAQCDIAREHLMNPGIVERVARLGHQDRPDEIKGTTDQIQEGKYEDELFSHSLIVLDNMARGKVFIDRAGAFA